jgi:chorismate mutase-like protein
MTLNEHRNEIDTIDSQILALLSRRAEIAREIGVAKAKAGLPVLDWERESEILSRLSRENEGILDDEAIARIYRLILQESRLIQLNTLAASSKSTKIGR